jgi:carboxypeptidase family protein
MKSPIITVAFLSLLALAAVAQDQTGRIEGVVVDAISHQPVKKATVSLNLNGRFAGEAAKALKNGGLPSSITDASGSFSFTDLPAGKYQLTVMQQNYPQTLMGGARKAVDVQAGDTAQSVTVELMPGGAISGRIVDEDGDPLGGCFVQPHPAKNINQGVQIMRLPEVRDDGSYRLFGIPAGKYIIAAQCGAVVFQPRPLSEGPDPPPSSAYPIQYYSAASDVKSAEVVDLSAGAEKSGVDFQMRPVPVTHIHGKFTSGSADRRGHGDLQVQLVPLAGNGQRTFAFSSGAEVNEDGSFDIRQVFPGSYQIVASSQEFSAGPQPEMTGGVGGVLRVDVTDKPLEVSLPLYRAMDISGKVEIEHNNNGTFQITPSQINIRLDPKNQFPTGPRFTQVNEDGTFSIKGVLPGEWRIRVNAPRGFLKLARMGGDDVTNRPLNLTSGAAGLLEIAVGLDTGTIQGTAPPGQMVFAAVIEDDEPGQGWRMASVDSTGQFKMEGLPPGKYRVAVGENGAPMPDGGQEVSVAEGEVATVEMKPESQP